MDIICIYFLLNNSDITTSQDLGLNWIPGVTEHVAITFLQEEKVINMGCHSSSSTFIPANSNPELSVFSLGLFSSCPKSYSPLEKTLPLCWGARRILEFHRSLWKAHDNKQTVKGHHSWLCFSLGSLQSLLLSPTLNPQKSVCVHKPGVPALSCALHSGWMKCLRVTGQSLHRKDPSFSLEGGWGPSKAVPEASPPEGKLVSSVFLQQALLHAQEWLTVPWALLLNHAALPHIKTWLERI